MQRVQAVSVATWTRTKARACALCSGAWHTQQQIYFVRTTCIYKRDVCAARAGVVTRRDFVVAWSRILQPVDGCLLCGGGGAFELSDGKVNSLRSDARDRKHSTNQKIVARQ